jgi:hypothetical protein
MRWALLGSSIANTISATTDTDIRVDIVFSMQFVPRLYSEYQWEK